MSSFCISHNEVENFDFGIRTTDLNEEDVMGFLMEFGQHELISVSEWDVGEDGEEECVERLNATEWLEKHTEVRRVLKD